jgi:quercetin dioxygenase-like cupin family protein
MMAESEIFVEPSDRDWTETEPGVKRRLLAHNGQLMMVEVAFQKDAVGAPHSHPHIQASYVAAGSFEVTILGKTETLRRGHSFLVPSNAVHGVRALEQGLLIDAFTPARSEFLSR